MKYNVSIEVSQFVYENMMNGCSGIVAGRIDHSGKYYIKLWGYNNKTYAEDKLQQYREIESKKWKR